MNSIGPPRQTIRWRGVTPGRSRRPSRAPRSARRRSRAPRPAPGACARRSDAARRRTGSTGWPSTWNGVAVTRTLPRAGCGISGNARRASRCGGRRPRSATAPVRPGRRAARSASSARSRVTKPSSHATMRSRSGGQFCAARHRRGEARVLREVGPLHRLAQARPQLRRADRLHRRRRRPRACARPCPARGPGIDLAAVDDGAVGDVLGGDHRLQHRHVEVGALARCAPRRTSPARMAPKAWVPASTSAACR